MSISKEDLIKLGFGGSLNLNAQSQFIDDDKITHKSLQNVTLDIINAGTLRDPQPQLILKNKIISQTNWDTYKTYHIPIQFEDNYTNYRIEIPIIGQVSYFAPDEYFFNAEEYDYFQQFYKTTQKPIGTNITGTFIRSSFTEKFSNTKILTGKFAALKQITGNSTYNSNLYSISGYFTGTDFKNSSYYRAWSQFNTSGVISGNPNYNGFYLPYPNTLDNWNYNAYACSLKIAPMYNHPTGDKMNSKNLNGIIVISTGDGTSTKICYISPHQIKTGYQNTLVYSSEKVKNLFNTGFLNKKISSGILIPTLSLGSEYYTGDIFPKSGIVFNYNINASDLTKSSVTGISGFVSNFTLGTNEYLKQETPISQTLFYKFYSGLYTGNKTFNTGTWNGIIPTGAVFNIELISTELNKKIGTHNQFFIVYSGFGTNDVLDAKINKYITNNTIEDSTTGITKFTNTQVQVYENKISAVGRGYGANSASSLNRARTQARFNISNKLSQIIKNNLPELIKQNRKYKKLQKFLQNKRSA
jgi:hypothetical protein